MFEHISTSMQEISKLTYQSSPFARRGRINDVDTTVLLWTELYLKVLNKHAPKRMIKLRKRPKPWFTAELQDLINKKDQLREDTQIN